MSGWIKLKRNLLNWEWYEDSNAVRLLVHLLISVNYEPKKYKGRLIEAGQIWTSTEKLSLELGLSYKQIRIALDKLEGSNEITRERAGKGQLVTLVKWGEIQQGEENEGNEKAVKGQDEGRKRATTKEVKNIRSKELKKEEYTLLSSLENDDVRLKTEYDQISFAFWNLFKSNAKTSKTTSLDKAKLEDYSKDVRLMIEKDQRTREEFSSVFKFLQTSDFWGPNIQSISKLRKQFETLYAQSQRGNTPGATGADEILSRYQ